MSQRARVMLSLAVAIAAVAGCQAIPASQPAPAPAPAAAQATGLVTIDLAPLLAQLKGRHVQAFTDANATRIKLSVMGPDLAPQPGTLSGYAGTGGLPGSLSVPISAGV